MFEHIEQLRGKPKQVRERIAYGSAALITTLVAIGWFAVVASSGTFSLQSNKTLAESAQQQQRDGRSGQATVAQAESGFAKLSETFHTMIGMSTTSSSGSDIVVERTQVRDSAPTEHIQTVIPF